MTLEYYSDLLYAKLLALNERSVIFKGEDSGAVVWDKEGTLYGAEIKQMPAEDKKGYSITVRDETSLKPVFSDYIDGNPFASEGLKLGTGAKSFEGAIEKVIRDFGPFETSEISENTSLKPKIEELSEFIYGSIEEEDYSIVNYYYIGDWNVNQWYGETSSGRPVYIRYDKPLLSMRIGGERGVDGNTYYKDSLKSRPSSIGSNKMREEIEKRSKFSFYDKLTKI